MYLFLGTLVSAGTVARVLGRMHNSVLRPLSDGNSISAFLLYDANTKQLLPLSDHFASKIIVHPVIGLRYSLRYMGRFIERDLQFH